MYVSFGTVLGRMSFAGEVYRAVIDAVTGLDARVLVTTGHGFDTSRLRDVPGNVHVEAWVDQADVLGEAGLVVCHGGSGTTYGALAAGVPLVVVPVFADQFANAPKVAQARRGHAGPHGPGLPGTPAPGRPGRRAANPPGHRDGARRWFLPEAAQAVAADMAAAPAIAALLASPPWAGRGLVSGRTSRWRPG